MNKQGLLGGPRGRVQECTCKWNVAHSSWPSCACQSEAGLRRKVPKGLILERKRISHWSVSVSGLSRDLFQNTALRGRNGDMRVVGKNQSCSHLTPLQEPAEILPRSWYRNIWLCAKIPEASIGSYLLRSILQKPVPVPRASVTEGACLYCLKECPLLKNEQVPACLPPC